MVLRSGKGEGRQVTQWTHVGVIPICVARGVVAVCVGSYSRNMPITPCLAAPSPPPIQKGGGRRRGCMGKMVEEEKDWYHRHTCIDLGRGTPLSLARLVWQTEILVNVDWHGSSRKRVQKGCIITLLFKWIREYSCCLMELSRSCYRLTCTDPEGTCTNITI